MLKKNLKVGTEYVLKVSYGSPRGWRIPLSLASRPNSLTRVNVLSTNIAHWEAANGEIKNSWGHLRHDAAAYKEKTKSLVVVQHVSWDGSNSVDTYLAPFAVNTSMLLREFSDYAKEAAIMDAEMLEIKAASEIAMGKLNAAVEDLKNQIVESNLKGADIKIDRIWEGMGVNNIKATIPVTHLTFILKQFTKMRIELLTEGRLPA